MKADGRVIITLELDTHELNILVEWGENIRYAATNTEGAVFGVREEEILHDLNELKSEYCLGK